MSLFTDLDKFCSDAVDTILADDWRFQPVEAPSEGCLVKGIFTTESFTAHLGMSGSAASRLLLSTNRDGFSPRPPKLKDTLTGPNGLRYRIQKVIDESDARILISLERISPP